MTKKGMRNKAKNARKLHRVSSRPISKKIIASKAKPKKIVVQKLAPSQKAAAKCVKKLIVEPIIANSLLSLAGENATSVLGQMEGAMSDEEIARACKFKVSEVRAVLNKLHAQGIAVYERTRDRDTGWYYYKWSANVGAIERMLDENVKSEKMATEQRLKYENACNMYSCDKCMQEKYPFETALDYLFKCPQCGSPLEYKQPGASEANLPKKPGR
ncbi:MAG: hypothetical protein Q7T16_03405 [Candidatus Burarchaeum sp.]|nr:hypothetical protein [Candidatus Burarchaeum sp.]MDO8339678.1 hypothetical protein [Candidatus Burarchaeum sp.]